MTSDVISHVTDDWQVDLEKQDTIDGPDMSLSNSKLISDEEKDPELPPLYKLVLPPVELDKVNVGYNVGSGVALVKVEATKFPCI